MVLVGGSPDGQHGVDVTDHFETGIQSLRAHAAYLAGLGGGAMSDPTEFLTTVASETGKHLGCRYAVGFERIEM